MRKLFIAIVAAAFVVGSFIPAMAAPYGAKDMAVTFDGRVQFDTYWQDSTKERTGTDWSDTEINWVEHDSRFRIKFAKGPLKAQFEVQDQNAVFKTFWAEWNFGPGFLWIGRDDPLTFNPTDLPPPRGTYAGVAIGANKADAIRVRFPLGPVTISLQAMTPVQEQYAVTPFTTTTDKELPAFEAKVDFQIGPVAMAVFGGMNSYSEVTTKNKEYDIDSNVIGIVARYFAGPFSFHGSIQRDENSYCSYPPPWPTDKVYGKPAFNVATDSILDTTNTGWHVNANYQLNDMLGFSAGYGENSLERENPGFADHEEEGSSWWVAVPVKITEFFTISPLYGVADWEDCTNGTTGVVTERGKVKYYGAHWQIQW